MTVQADLTTAGVIQSAVHDLKGPAGRLRLLVQLLSRSLPNLDEDTQSLFKHVEDSAAAVGTVAEGLRSYSEIYSRTVERQPVDLNATVAGCVADLRGEIAAAGAEVECGELPAIDGDPYLIAWIVRELIGNAIRFHSGESPRVRISAAAGTVAVADNGPGIAPQFRERVFRPFLKLSAQGSAGLGLTICRKIVEMHGGQIWVEPRTDGAEIRFRLDGDQTEAPACE